MKKLISALTIVAILAIAVLSVCAAANSAVPPGPAPKAGDGVSDGSGLNPPYGNLDNPGTGPAPSSGDSSSNGSGF